MGRRGELKSIRIDKLDPAGFATGATKVNGVLPRERVRVRIDHSGKRGVDYGSLVEVLEPAEDRVPVPCDQFLTCGGCDFLHADLSFQHHHKRKVVAEALNIPLASVDPVVASPRAFGYRALAKLVVGPDRILGSYRPRTHDVVNMRGCLIHAPEAEVVVDHLRALIKEPAELDLRYVLVRASIAEQRCIVTLVTRTEAAPGVRAIAEALFERADVARVSQHVNDHPGDALLVGEAETVLFDDGPPVERIGAVAQTLASGAFSQVNPLAAAALYQVVAEMAEPAGKRIIDLYAGSGGIALTLASLGASVVAVETHAGAAEAAQKAAPPGVEVVCEDVAAFDLPEADVLVLNPPRKGAAASVLSRIQAPHVIYVSCNPQTLARDLEVLGGVIMRVVPVDLFPQTRHVETVVSVAL